MARIYIVCITVLSCFQYFHKLTKWLVFFFFFNAHLVVLNFPLFTSECEGIYVRLCVYMYINIDEAEILTSEVHDPYARTTGA